MALAFKIQRLFFWTTTTYLMNHQLEILSCWNDLKTDFSGAVLHDINLAARFSHQLIAMKTSISGISRGRVEQIMTSDILRGKFFRLKPRLLRSYSG